MSVEGKENSMHRDSQAWGFLLICFQLWRSQVNIYDVWVKKIVDTCHASYWQSWKEIQQELLPQILGGNYK